MLEDPPALGTGKGEIEKGDGQIQPTVKSGA